MPRGAAAGEIVVLAGVNGAGKSSVAGAAFKRHGGEFYNPDAATQRYVEAGLSRGDANGRAWNEGRRLLEHAIRDRLSFAFETTLGGRTIAALLLHGAQQGTPVRMVYVGLSSPELHIARVRARVARGGHDIPESRIRARWNESRKNLIRLLPYLTELVLWDNSAEADLDADHPPAPARLLSMRAGRIRSLGALDQIPSWARPIVMAAQACDASITGGR